MNATFAAQCKEVIAGNVTITAKEKTTLPPAPLERRCAWCDLITGEIPPPGSTHGVCKFHNALFTMDVQQCVASYQFEQQAEELLPAVLFWMAFPENFYCPIHCYNPPKNSGFCLCPKCEMEAVA
jgi:hypothetical protein